MDIYNLTKTRMINGIWEGVINDAGQDKPQISAAHLGDPVADITLENKDKTWLVRIPIPASAIADGVHTIVISDARNDTQIGDITLIGGEVLGGDIRAELNLLRAELDTLKRAFRRHCAETE